MRRNIMDECAYLQYINNNDFYCTLCNENGLVHPNCACQNCSDYNRGPIYVRSYAEKIEISE